MSELLDHNAAPSCVHVEAGTYSIGNDSIPQAGPRHQTCLKEFWIDASAVSLAHLEVFIASGGYFESRWWSDSPQGGRAFLDSGSIDKRCIGIHMLSNEVTKRMNPRPRFSREVPAVGITWMEAAAVCRFFGARLPFESEWEVAMQTDEWNNSTGTAQAKKQMSRCGCELHLGLLEEWTAGAFTTRHWRGVDSFEFAAVDAPYGVCLRGSTRESLFTDTAFRSSGDPRDPREFRGFRRVWCEAPTYDQLSIDFRGGHQ